MYPGQKKTTQWTASVHTLHVPKPNVTRVQSATQWTASVHTLHMHKPNVTRVQSATQWTASVHTLHMPKPNVNRVLSANYAMDCFGPYFTNVQTCDATPCCNLFVIHAFIFCHSCLTLNDLNGKIPNRENQAQKVLKSEMFEMLVFVVNYIGIWWSMKMWCCNCVGKHTHEVSFFKKTHTF